MNNRVGIPWWRTPSGMVLIGFLAIAGFFLITEHTAHVLGVLPFLLLAACPLMHRFMHHVHGVHDGAGGDGHQHDRMSGTTGGRDGHRH